MTTRMLRLLPCLAALLMLGLPALTRAATLNVPTTAYPTIQDAVNDAANGDTVLVAAGNYSGPGNRDIDSGGKSLTVMSQSGAGSTIIDCGGYNSTDGSGNHRGFYIRNGQGNVTINGFTVKNGYETNKAVSPDDPTIIYYNGYGGGIYIRRSNATILNCIITNNTADYGGGIRNENNGLLSVVVTLSNCTISANTAKFDVASGSGGSGGGVYNRNYAFNTGGSNNSNFSLIDCTVTGNTAAYGGGAVNRFECGTVTMTRCLVSNNIASVSGGGVLTDTSNFFQVGDTSGAASMNSCTIVSNKATYGGGLACFDDNGGTTTLTDCTISGNSVNLYTDGTDGQGGGVYNNNNYSGGIGTTTLTNCTMSANIAPGDGSSIYNDNSTYSGTGTSGTITVTNSIVHSASKNEILDGLVSYSDVQGGYPGTGNIDKDPLFVNASTGDLHLKPGSPCLGKGTASGAPATDKDGRTRLNPPSMGAYELAATLEIPAQYPTIQTAVTAARSGDTVMVASGTYTGPGNVDWDFGGKDVTVKSANGAANTIIDCGGTPSTDGSGNHRGFYIHSGETNAVIDGITIKNGYESYVAGVADSGYGGSICVDGGSAAVKNCVFTGSTATIAGGGAAAIGKRHHSITFTNCTFTKNTAPNGGGVYSSNDGGTVNLSNSSVSNNTAQNGGGVCNKNSGGSTSLTSCSVADNTAKNSGGGVYNENDVDSGTITLLNCSVSGNASPLGGGVYDFNSNSDDTILLINGIVYGDSGGEVSDNALTASATNITFSDIQGGYSGTGNINADPLFVNIAANDLHVKPGSPCLGKGTSDGAPTTDKDGNTRPNPPSMGAYEVAAVPAAITSFTLSPNQIAAPGPVVTANVSVTGNFAKVTVSPAPGSLSAASPTFNLLTNSGGGWGGTFPTTFLKLAKTNPITFVATGTRADGTTATATARLIVGALPALSLTISSDKSAVSAGQTFSVKGFVRDLTATIATPVVVTIALPTYLSFVSSPDFTFNPAQNTITWTGPLAAYTGSHAISVEFKASSSTPTNKQIAITVTASAPDFQSMTQSASIVVGAPPAPIGVDIDSSGAAGQADGTAIITSAVGASPLLAVISPVSGLEHSWLGVDHAYDTSGSQLSPTADASVGSLAAVLGLAGPGVSPTYAASFARIGSQCNIGLRLTYPAALMNIANISVTAVLGAVGASDVTPAKVLSAYNELSKVQAFNDVADQLMTPAKTPWGAAVQTALVVKDIIDMNPNDIEKFAAALSKVEGKEIIKDRVKGALRVLGVGTAIAKIVQIVADEISFTIGTGGADAEITFTGSAARHPEQLR